MTVMRQQKVDRLSYLALMMACLLVMSAVFGVPLQSDQHAALMALYEGLGNFLLFFFSRSFFE